jgi:hypothetical protein
MESSMGTSPAAPDRALLDATRRQRAELRESISALELALARPGLSERVRWAERVHVALVELSADFRQHLLLTEGPNGLYADIRATSPRLSAALDHLTREHAQISDLVDDLLARTLTPRSSDVDEVRRQGTALLGRLVSHRQRGSDLVYEAYEVDVGGEA